MIGNWKAHPNHVPDNGWQILSVNLISELPQSHGYDPIMVVVDHLSKHAHIGLMTFKNISISRVAGLFRDHI